MTRCLLSEVHFAINTRGEANPCCRYTPVEGDSEIITIEGKTASDIFNHPRLKNIRNNLKNGIRDKGCYHCWNEEDTNIKSMRIYSNENLKKMVSFENYNDLLSLEIAFSNHCNMKCRHCDSSSSSKWREDDEKLNRWMPEKMLQEPDISKLKLEQFKNIKVLKILGGEPLLSKEHTKFIQSITDTGLIRNIHIDITTNGSIYPNETIIEGWKQAKSVLLVISLDDVEEQYNYFRTGGDFEVVKNNMKRLEELNIENMSFAIHIVVNALNLYRMNYILEYFVDNFNKWDIHIDKIHQPEYLSIDQWGKDDIQDCMPLLKKLIFNPKVRNKIGSVDRIYNMIKTLPNNKSDFSALFDFNDKLDKIRNTSLNDVHPIFKDYR